VVRAWEGASRDGPYGAVDDHPQSSRAGRVRKHASEKGDRGSTPQRKSPMNGGHGVKRHEADGPVWRAATRGPHAQRRVLHAADGQSELIGTATGLTRTSANAYWPRYTAIRRLVIGSPRSNTGRDGAYVARPGGDSDFIGGPHPLQPSSNGR